MMRREGRSFLFFAVANAIRRRQSKPIAEVFNDSAVSTESHGDSLVGAMRLLRGGSAAGLLLLVIVTGCNGVDATWSDETKLHRQDKNGDIPIPDYPVGECGTVSITAELTDSGTSIKFEFTPKTPPPEGCCEAYGWIQHVTTDGGWTYDNAAEGSSTAAGGTGRGAKSDPTADPQGKAEGDRWDPNPWYGGKGNVTDELGDDLPDDWDRSPRPQTSIRDTPGGNDGFITQLVCVESGAIKFQYRWRQQRPRGSTQWQFLGAEGTNLTLTPR